MSYIEQSCGVMPSSGRGRVATGTISHQWREFKSTKNQGLHNIVNVRSVTVSDHIKM